MSEEFEFRDLSGAEFWGVDLRGATVRDVDLSGVRVAQARLVDVEIDAEIDRLVVNGVDVTDYVHERDEWFVLRSQVPEAGPDAIRRAVPDFVAAWERAIERVEALPDEQRHASVGGEWSFVDTLRHLVFATDKWCTVPVLGGAFHPIGLPNTGSADFGWPGLDAAAAPTFAEVVAVWRDRWAQVAQHVEGLEPAALAVEVEVLENGQSTVASCISVVFEEHFQHLRYALRDLDRLA